MKVLYLKESLETYGEQLHYGNSTESAREKFKDDAYLDPRCNPAFLALLDSPKSLKPIPSGFTATTKSLWETITGTKSCS